MPKREIPEINAGSMADIAFLLLIFFLVTTTIALPEKGQPTELPPDKKTPPTDQPDELILDRNVLIVKANKNNNLLIDNEDVLDESQVEELYDMTLKFFGSHKNGKEIDDNGDGEADYPIRQKVEIADLNAEIERWETALEDWPEEKDDAYPKSMLNKAKAKKRVYEDIGSFYDMPKICLIKFESDKGTSYGFYIKVLDQMNKALNELRNEYCQETWGINFDDLDTDPNNQEDADKILIVKILYPDKIIDSSNKSN